MAETPHTPSHAFSESELMLLERLNAMSQREFTEWYRVTFEPRLHSLRVVTACNHILGGRVEPEPASG